MEEELIKISRQLATNMRFAAMVLEKDMKKVAKSNKEFKESMIRLKKAKEALQNAELKEAAKVAWGCRTEATGCGKALIKTVANTSRAVYERHAAQHQVNQKREELSRNQRAARSSGQAFGCAVGQLWEVVDHREQ